MMKLIIFAVLGLLVGIGGGSAVAVMNAKKAYAADVAHKASLVADSLAQAEEDGTAHAATDAHAADSAATVDTAAAETHVAAAEDHAPTPAPAKVVPPKNYSRAVQTVESNGAPGSVPRTATKPAPPPKPIPTAAAPAPGAAKVAKIFAAMPPKDAAMVLEQLDDNEVQSVISSLSEKQAAAILRNFPPPRAALISKGVLRSALAKP
jgi:hypothetical protein